jgi:cyclophilin family peptidyl-prolyl cis-trans isomerase
MPPPPYRRLAAVFLSVFLGWFLVLPGPVEASRGSVQSAGSPKSPAPQGVPPAGSRSVQAPPLQAPADVPSPGNPVVVVTTSLGDIRVELFKDQAPVSVANFLRYANEGFYAETIFHRVKKGFMIQGGGFTASLVEKPGHPPILNEATNGLRNARGTLGMARRVQLRSATSQFYINVVDNRVLDHTGYAPDEFGYAVFGRVLSGMEVVDAIAAVPTTTSGGMEDVPVEPVIIVSVRVIR